MVVGDTHKIDIEFAKLLATIPMAFHALLPPHIECCVIVTTSGSGIQILEPRTLDKTRQMTFAAHGVKDVF